MSTNDTMMTNEKEHSQQQQQQQQQQQEEEEEEEEEEENINKDHGKDTDTDTGRLVVVVVKEEEEDNNNNMKTYNYFAIGSMINPIAIKLRGINPITTVPAELVNHHISFFSTLGIAEPIENNHSIDDNDETVNTDNNTDNDNTYPTMHGVIHTLTADDMKRLDYIEKENHTRVNAIARLYDGTEINVTVYKRNIDVHSNNDNDDNHTNSSTIPYERYIDIMIDGCIHYGVNEQYINYLRQHDKLPRPKPDEYLSFGLPDNENDNFLTIEQVIANDGLDGRPLYSIINNKVIVLSTDIGLKDYNGFIKFRQRMGYYNDIIMAKMVYDPKYGIPTTVKDFTPDHAAYCEHNLCHYYQMRNFLQFFKPIAWLKE